MKMPTAHLPRLVLCFCLLAGLPPATIKAQTDDPADPALSPSPTPFNLDQQIRDAASMDLDTAVEAKALEAEESAEQGIKKSVENLQEAAAESVIDLAEKLDERSSHAGNQTLSPEQKQRIEAAKEAVKDADESQTSP